MVNTGRIANGVSPLYSSAHATRLPQHFDSRRFLRVTPDFLLNDARRLKSRAYERLPGKETSDVRGPSFTGLVRQKPSGFAVAPDTRSLCRLAERNHASTDASRHCTPLLRKILAPVPESSRSCRRPH